MKPLFAVKSFGLADIFLLLLWIGIATLTWHFMHGADHFLELTREALGKYFKVRWLLILHITAGGGALILGPFLFWERFRTNYWKLHRRVGTLYLLAILASGLSAVVLAFTTAYELNWHYAFSLQVWVIVWIASSFIAYWTAIKKRFKLHKEWMTRSYIVTVAFVISGSLVKMPFIQRLGDFSEILTTFIWFGWSVPLYLYDVILAFRKKG
ncbi:Predicted membrane protein [Chitinophaga sp. CF118]|uniref:DUF2306 domain-containing protein n=1 Tax=Chitinophaga sp. CF118 TaxID=1884367 RepID=UPI0008ED85D0|nr:DUF2306 domain-containing protein [Chitinophaga sp. CF118]SFE98549.1 Predicted membrane protein [Chitinophaga sp. CF118]